MPLTRYHCALDTWSDDFDMVAADDGEYVLYEDVEALRATLDADVYRIQVLLQRPILRPLMKMFIREAVFDALALIEADGINPVEWAAEGTRERPRRIIVELVAE